MVDQPDLGRGRPSRPFVTAWNTGTPRPFAVQPQPGPGPAEPNLVVGRLGHRGEVSFTFNNSGSVHLIADLVGYFDPGEQRRTASR